MKSFKEEFKKLNKLIKVYESGNYENLTELEHEIYSTACLIVDYYANEIYPIVKKSGIKTFFKDLRKNFLGEEKQISDIYNLGKLLDRIENVKSKVYDYIVDYQIAYKAS